MQREGYFGAYPQCADKVVCKNDGAICRSHEEALDHAIVVRAQQLNQLGQEEGNLQDAAQ